MKRMVTMLVLAALVAGVSMAGVTEDKALCAKYIPAEAMSAELAKATRQAIASNTNTNQTNEAIASLTERRLYGGWARSLAGILTWGEQTAELTADQADALLTGRLDVATLSPGQRASLWYGGDINQEGWTATQWARTLSAYRRSELSEKLLAAAGGIEQSRIELFLYLDYNRIYVTQILDGIQSDVRRKLRDEGKSIVTVDGVNPIEEAMRPLFTACNAPMLEGLEAAVAEVNGKTVVVDRSMKGDLANLQEQVWYGDAHANGVNLNGIRYLLGTEGYNKWVSEYNGK
jgi:hypothetical protein